MKKNISMILVLINFFIVISVFPQWQQSGNYTGNVLSFTARDSILVSGTYGSGVYITSDGINWSYSSEGMTNMQIISLTVCNGFFFAGSETGGIYKSINNGLNWSAVNNGLSSLAIHTVCSNNGKIYAGTNAGINLSTDNGNNWNRISFSPLGNTIYALCSFGDTIFTGTSTGTYYSINNGANWNNINSGLSGSVYCLMKFGNAVYAGTSSSGIYKTSDCGATWIHINSGLPAYAIRGLCYYNEKIFAATYGGGIYYSTNYGVEWIPSVLGLTELVCYSVIQYRNYLFCGTKSGIFKRSLLEFTYVQKEESNLSTGIKLFNNYPNPFNSSTKIVYKLEKPENVTIKIFDLLGKELITLVNTVKPAGVSQIIWNGRDSNGLEMPSGIYFIRLKTERAEVTKKVTLLK